MKKIEKFDQEAVDALHGEFRDAVEAVAKKHGLRVVQSNGTYDDSSWNLKYRIEVGDADRLNFEANAKYVGLKPNDLGKSFKIGDKVYTIVGLASLRKAKPVIAERDGNRYVFGADVVKDVLSGRDLAAEHEAKLDAREAEGLKLKPGDLRVLADIKPKYLCDDLRVRVLKVMKAKKLATVEWADKDDRAEKRTGPKFEVALAVLAPVPAWLERLPLREKSRSRFEQALANSGA